MSLKAKLYFSFIGYVIHTLTKLYSLIGGRNIVYGYYCKKTKQYLKKTRIASTAVIVDKKNLVIGDNVWINHYARIDASGGVDIGEGCQIGFACAILTHSSHIAIRLMGTEYMNHTPNKRIGYIHKPVKIGAYSFIGGGSYILPGVTIGKGCVVGVNAVVTKDIPDYAIVAGVPAKIIGSTKDVDRPFMNNPEVKRSYYENK